LLNVKDLKTFFYTRDGVAKAVNAVNFTLERGQILGVVGESGCGKSVTALSILRIVPHPGKIVSGEIWFNEVNLLQLTSGQMRQIRGNRISMIFQDPLISLNPAFTIGDQLTEALRIHRQISKEEARRRAVEMLHLVEIPEPERRVRYYPHQLSGGMQQRAMIAEALLLNPEVLIADEPTTALDVTIQAQVLDIMVKLTQEMRTAVILITHNLGLVAERAHRVVVMYASKVAEEGPVEAIFEDAKHPYTQGLLRSVPLPGKRRGEQREPLYEIKGIVPSLFDLPSGCAFHPRCGMWKDICMRENPPWQTLGPGHSVACWLYA
jgi:oligopeptide/dipeptide ABC transporter ATP-binding protein